MCYAGIYDKNRLSCRYRILLRSQYQSKDEYTLKKFNLDYFIAVEHRI